MNEYYFIFIDFNENHMTDHSNSLIFHATVCYWTVILSSKCTWIYFTH